MAARLRERDVARCLARIGDPAGVRGCEARQENAEGEARMTRRIGNIVVIEREPDRVCEQCGAVGECRPWGPKGEQICADCGEKPGNRASVEAHLSALFSPLH